MTKIVVNILVTLMLIFSVQLFAQGWRSLGLENEPITVITVDWSDPNIIYAGSGSDFSAGTVGGIFKTTNAGAAWDTLVRGVAVRDIDIHPRNSNILYATLGINVFTTAGIIKSLDGGETWFNAGNGIRTSWEEGPNMLVIDYEHPDTLYTGTHGFGGGLPYKSIDGGMTWRNINPDTGWVWLEISPGDSILIDPFLDGVLSIAMDPTDAQHLFWGTLGLGALVETWDGGETWNTTGLRENILILDIGINPYNTQQIYVGTRANSAIEGILFSTDGGDSWSKINGNIENHPLGVYAIEFFLDNENPGIYIIANSGDTGGIYTLQSNQEWKKIGIDQRRVETITISGHHIYAGRLGETLGGVYAFDLLTNVEDNEKFVPEDFDLSIFPNPANSKVTLSYQLPQSALVRIEVFDILGRRQKLLMQQNQPAGKYKQNATIDSLPNGIYFIRMVAGKQTFSRKIIMLK